MHRDKQHLVNSFEFHREITTKHRLIKNLLTHFQNDPRKVFDITPVTFILDLE